MSREVRCTYRGADGEAVVTALLESREIVVRGALRRRIPLDAVTAVVEGEDLRLDFPSETIFLGVGAVEAARWVRKIATPPPTLRTKLGLAAGATALILGDVPPGPLSEALDSAAGDHLGAAMTVAIVAAATDIGAALARHRALAPTAPIWIVHGKGKGIEPGEAAVRSVMRAAGYMDNKVAAVSEMLSATRYSSVRAEK